LAGCGEWNVYDYDDCNEKLSVDNLHNELFRATLAAGSVAHLSAIPTPQLAAHRNTDDGEV